jgi:hypothetical protein
MPVRREEGYQRVQIKPASREVSAKKNQHFIFGFTWESVPVVMLSHRKKRVHRTIGFVHQLFDQRGCVMNFDNGLFALIFAGLGMCGLYFWSALRDRLSRLVHAQRESARYRVVHSTKMSGTGSDGSPTSSAMSDSSVKDDQD